MPARNLQNVMLYRNFVRKVMKRDPNFDPETIDRTLEPEEAYNDLVKKGRIRSGDGGQQQAERNFSKEFRDNLHDGGIKHPSLQNFIMRLDKPARQKDLDKLAYIMGARPHKNVRLDIKRKARIARTAAQYANSPNRFDIPGVDTPGSKFDEDWF